VFGQIGKLGSQSHFSSGKNTGLVLPLHSIVRQSSGTLRITSFLVASPCSCCFKPPRDLEVILVKRLRDFKEPLQSMTMFYGVDLAGLGLLPLVV